MQGKPTWPTPSGMDKVLVGVCHHLNNQLAAINGYVFLLRKRDRLGEYDEPLQAQLDQLERSVRMLRSLLRDGPTAPMPVSLADLVQTATEVMADYPGGPVRFALAPGQEPTIVRAEWVRLLRAVLEAGTWITRDGAGEREVLLTVSSANGSATLVLDRAEQATPTPDGAISTGIPAPEAGSLVEYLGDRTARITVPATPALPPSAHPS